MFGSDPRICDIFLGERDTGFNDQQFYITFNKRKEVIFKNKSRKKVQINYNSEIPYFRNQFIWILFDTYENIKITLNEKDDLIFEIKWPENRDSCRAEYEAHRETYFEERRNAFPPFNQLDIENQPTTAMPTAQYSPRQKPPEQEPIYLLKKKLGRDDFDTIHKTVDINTGDVHATKKFHHGD